MSPARVVLLMTLLAAFGAQALEILEPPVLRGKRIESPVMRWLPSPFEYTGVLVSWSQRNSTDLKGKAVLSAPGFADSPTTVVVTLEDSVNTWKALGVSVAIYANTVCRVAQGGGSEVLVNRRDFDNFTDFTYVEIGEDEGYELEQLLHQYGNLTVHIGLADKNVWAEIRRGPVMIIWQLVFSLAYGVCAALSGAKLAAYVRAQGWVWSVAHITLALITIANTFRCIYCAVDPIFLGRFFLAREAHMMTTITFPIESIATLLLALYWHEMLNSSRIRVTTFLNKMKIPFILVSILIFALEVASSAIRAAGVTGLGTLTYVGAAVYVSVDISVCLFFFIVGAKVRAQLKEGEKISFSGAASKSRKTLRRTTNLLVINGVFMVCWLVGFLFLAIPQVFWNAYGFHATFTLVHGALVGSSFLQALTFKIPFKRRDGSGTRSTLPHTSSHQMTSTKDGSASGSKEVV